MGLLDDAIREHLELKRKHGADPREVDRQEQEALGPTIPHGEFAQPDAADGHGVDDLAPEDDVAAYAAPDELPEDEPDVPEEPATGHEAAAPGYDEDPWVEEEAEGDEPRAAGAEPTEEHDDVLEETPDFLQETPEHDRLWFEQKPPRDFDWDR